VVARARRILQERSIGHLGTLDPAASGVLPLLLGRLTRLAQFFMHRPKVYEGEIYLGVATDTYDASGVPQGVASDQIPPLEAIEAALARLRGPIEQRPPAFSAKKVAGVRAYKLARTRQAVELPLQSVTVEEFSPLRLEGRILQFRVRCSTGTYVRSLAHDLGQHLGIGAHLQRLRRTAVGEFEIQQAITLATLEQRLAAGDLHEWLVPPALLLPEWPAVFAPPETANRLLQGRAVNLPEFSQAPRVRIFAHDESLLAIGQRIAGTLFQPKIVFPP